MAFAHKMQMKSRPVTRAGASTQRAPAVRQISKLRGSVAAHAAMQALIFDCDGVILESEELHRLAYNAAFENFNVVCENEFGTAEWTPTYYDRLQNQVGGGKPKMRHFFGQEGWPTSDITKGVAKSEEDRTLLIDTLQAWKSQKYQDMIGSGEVECRPGVLRMMDEARAAGLKLAVCSAGTKSSIIFSLKSLIGEARFQALDLFLAGDDVENKKPDPQIYALAAQRLGLDPKACVVIEDSTIGLAAARGAGMRCIITYTSSTVSQTFPGAERIVCDLGSYPVNVTVAELMAARIVQDDRVSLTVSPDGDAVFFHMTEEEQDEQGISS